VSFSIVFKVMYFSERLQACHLYISPLFLKGSDSLFDKPGKEVFLWFVMSISFNASHYVFLTLIDVISTPKPGYLIVHN